MNKILIAFLLATLFAGCKKSDTPPSFQSYIRFKLDGGQTECTEHIRATYLPATIGPDNVITISGDWPGGSISLYLNESVVLSARQYLFEPFKWRSGEIWTTGPSGRHYGGGSCLACSQVDGPGQITFTEINAEFVKETFEFVTGVDIATTAFKTVTNGEFHIKRG